ncbi:HesA/MoeB/ThiF family protein [Loigolactobacillus bifermentans]|uniref:Molybdopterin biosynthesis protein MoeB n=1 Tax=Loigolactobacillus bifermentans DSM 20003 TaxID=1423726 RepID=A0A0R1H8S3_9LACO|nr:HesA/MoeB/ThiF family protein [Loigolactobacillus bifermentans]KRK40321.1 molybdopterin biosynthesis protein MoeB [Loigolactobacillus bifermentans DSM 20003]QGG59973.1 HesA/MoeB/ThiF family protein [Loigolactobacillus bifermentans]
MERYDRQIRVHQIGPSGQKRIEQSHVVIIGLGATGSYAAEQLTRAGIGALTLIDSDTVSLTNLQRQTLFDEVDVAHEAFKVEAAAEKLGKINHNVTLNIFPKRFTPELLAQVPAFDLVLDCTDNFTTRDLLNRLACNQGFAFIMASCAGTAGSVMLFDPKNGPCLNCAYPQLKALQARDCDTLGVNTALVPLVSALQISLALKYLIAPADCATDMMAIFDNWQLSLQHFKVQKNRHCPTCENLPAALPLPRTMQLRSLCGTNTYQVELDNAPTLDQVAAALTEAQIPFDQNQALLRFKWRERPFSYFKTGQCHLYDWPDTEQAELCFLDFYHFIKPIQIEEAITE